MTAGLPRVLYDILEAVIAPCDDIALVGTVRDPADAIDAMKTLRPDVVILGQQDADLPEIGRRLFEERAGIKVFGFADDGRRTFLYELRLHKTSVGEVSPEELLNAIRLSVTAGVN